MNSPFKRRFARARQDGATWRVPLFPVLLTVLLFSSPTLRAEHEPGAYAVDVESTAAPEGMTYARVRHIDGSLEVLLGSGTLERGVTINMPVVAGDVLITGPASRAEIQLADGTLLRLDSHTRVSVLALSDHQSLYENGKGAG